MGYFCKCVCDYLAAPAITLHKTPFPSFPLFLSLFHYSCTFQSVCNFVCCLLFHFYFLIVDRFLYLFFTSVHYLISLWDNISIVFKIGSMSLQRDMNEPILRAILMPKYVYFHVLNFKIFHFWHKIVNLTYCIIFWSLQKIEFLK